MSLDEFLYCIAINGVAILLFKCIKEIMTEIANDHCRF
jgi:hypothetical protein